MIITELHPPLHARCPRVAGRDRTAAGPRLRHMMLAIIHIIMLAAPAGRRLARRRDRVLRRRRRLRLHIHRQGPGGFVRGIRALGAAHGSE